MDFNPNLHHGLHDDQKPVLFHQQEHNGSGGGYMDPYHHQRSHPHGANQLPMNMKQDVDVVNKVTRQMYDYDLQHHSPSMSEGFPQNPPNPSSECSSPSPAPASAAAEYIRHQEMNRAHPRKRIYQDWNQVAIFSTPAEAEEGVRNFENCRWKVGNKFTSREGFKVYWSCREGVGCPVQIHLLYHSQLPRVVLYRNQPEHHHTERVKTRGLPAPVEALIRKLFNEGVNKPRRIQFILQKEGMEEVPQTKLSNFLVKLRREAAAHGHGESTPVKRARNSYLYDDEEEDEDDLYGRDNSEEKSNMSSMSPSSVIFPSVIMNTPPGEEGNNSMPMNSGISYHQQHHHLSGEQSNANFVGASSPYGIPPHMAGRFPSHNQGNFHSGGHHGGSENSPSFPHSLPYAAVAPGRNSESGPSHSSTKAEVDADQSEVVTCSSSPPKTLYCRDETTEDGEQCLPDEEEVKESIINHLRTNYSNRDMLHIRQELRCLKKENKYTALNRLLSFTAGFLQDTFLESHTTNPMPEDE